MSIILAPGVRLEIPGQGSVNAELWGRFQLGAAAHYRATGIPTRVNSVMRDTRQQAALYAAYLAGTGALAAKPGTSNHERGLAVDAQPANRPADAAWQHHFRAYGIHFPLDTPDRRRRGLRIEEWHAELDPNRKPLPLPPLPETEMTEAELTAIKAHIEHVVLKVLPDRVLAPMAAKDAHDELALAVNTLKRLEERLDRIEAKLG